MQCGKTNFYLNSTLSFSLFSQKQPLLSVLGNAFKDSLEDILDIYKHICIYIYVHIDMHMYTTKGTYSTVNI